MEPLNIDKTRTIKYPKKRNNFPHNSNPNNKIIQKYVDNPLINRFTLDSFFIYDQADNIKYYQSLTNKNLIKLSNDELLLLCSIANEIRINQAIKGGDELIEIDKDLADKLNSYFNINQQDTPLSKYIKDKISNSNDRSNISCRKLSNEYFKEKGEKVSKSTIHNIIKNQLGYRFLKTTLKNNFIKKDEGILACLCFLKIYVRCMKYNFHPIFIDETKVELINNHYRAWRFPGEELLFGNTVKAKNNLLLAVGTDRVFSYKMTKDNTTSDIFLDFLKDLAKEINKDTQKKYFLIMDNFRCHKTENVIEFLTKSKLNTIFNAPYYSSFNSIELTFRSIKKITYSNIYDSIDEVIADVEKYLKDDRIKRILLSNYRDTINQYIIYSQNKKDLNLKNLNI